MASIQDIVDGINKLDGVRVEQHKDLFLLHERARGKDLISREDLILFAVEHDVLRPFEEVE